MRIQVLDHGYVELVEAWGAGSADSQNGRNFNDYEAGIVEAARQSTQGSFRGWEAAACDCGHSYDMGAGVRGMARGINTEHAEGCASVRQPGDARLLKRLHDQGHATPFEFAGMVVEVQAPIFVFREWHRHRTMSYNEASARYAPLPDLYYHTTLDHVLVRAAAAAVGNNRQAAGVAEPDAMRIAAWLDRDRELSATLEAHYQEGLAAGVPKELARKKMPVDHYSRMRAAANLRNWLAFLTLRTAPVAQWEIRRYARAVARLVAATFPHTFSLWHNAQPLPLVEDKV